MRCSICGRETRYLVSCKGLKTKIKLCCKDCLHKKKTVAKVRKQKSKSKFSKEITQNDMFFYIAGYTSGGAPYGVTWEEMGLAPYESIE